MGERSVAYLRRGVSGEVVEATLIDGVSLEEVRDAEALWQPFLGQALQKQREAGATVFDLPEHKHWDWLRKAHYARTRRHLHLLGVACDGAMQGLMIADTDRRSRLGSQRDEPLVYVDYLAAAPWNLRSLTDRPRFSGVGRTLIGAAVQMSDSQGWQGRIGLHALPQAESFYRGTCHMTDLGPDEEYFGLGYFEMTPEQADTFGEGGWR